MEITGMDDEVRFQLKKMMSAKLCACITGQVSHFLSFQSKLVNDYCLFIYFLVYFVHSLAVIETSFPKLLFCHSDPFCSGNDGLLS